MVSPGCHHMDRCVESGLSGGEIFLMAATALPGLLLASKDVGDDMEGIDFFFGWDLSLTGLERSPGETGNFVPGSGAGFSADLT